MMNDRTIMRYALVVAGTVMALLPGAGALASERVTHFAVVITGLGDLRDRSQDFWSNNDHVRRCLKAYDYPDEAIYRLCEDGVSAIPAVNGRAIPANVRKVFQHLAKIMEPGDHLFVWLCGHGDQRQGDFYFHINGGLMASELKPLLDALPTSEITIGIQPCHGGAAIPALSGKGRVIVTSTSAGENNAHAWGIPEELFPRKYGKRGPSIKQAYNATIDRVLRDYNGKEGEHPLLDDNGDGVGHFGKAAVVGGDGASAAQRYLGDQGYQLVFSSAAIQKLRELNVQLLLSDLSRIARIFGEESAYLASLGGYSDPVANLTSSEARLEWARRQTPPRLVENLVDNYCLQFDRQARLGSEAAQRFYADASVRMASHGIDLFHGNFRDRTVHLNWARQQTIPKLREEIETKVRELLAGTCDAHTK